MRVGRRNSREAAASAEPDCEPHRARAPPSPVLLRAAGERPGSTASSFATEVAAFIERVILDLGYPGLAGLMLLENLFPPLPSELILPFVGFLVASGEMQLLPAMAASILGSVSGALVLYGLARSLGESRLRRFLARYGSYMGVSVAAYDRGAGVLRRNAGAILFWSRFVPGLRSAISLPAGVTGLPLAIFVAWTVVGSSCWNVVLIGAGILLGRNWGRILPILERYESVLLWAAGILAAGFLVHRLLASARRRGPPRGTDPPE